MSLSSEQLIILNDAARKMTSYKSMEEAKKISIDGSEWTAEARLFAIEFLRTQWISMNGLSNKMDRSYFEYL